MRKLLTYMVLMLSFIGCTYTEEVSLPLAEIPGGGVRFSDPAKTEELKAELDQLGVKYWVQEDGMITYLLVQKALFRKAERKVSYGENLSRNIRETEFGLSKFEYDMLKEELESAGIQFDELQDSRGEPSIYWGQNDGPRVDGIIQKVGIASFEHHKENRSEKLN